MTPSTTVIPSSTTAARPRHPTALMHAPSGPLLPSALDHTTCLASAPPSHRAVGPAGRLRGQGRSGQGMETGPGNAPARNASDENGGLESSIGSNPRQDGVAPGHDAALVNAPDTGGTHMAAPVVWFEIAGRDLDALTRFYGDLLGWKVDADNPQHYGMVDTGADGRDAGDSVVDADQRHGDVAAHGHATGDHLGAGVKVGHRPVDDPRVERGLSEDRPHVPPEVAEDAPGDLLA